VDLLSEIVNDYHSICKALGPEPLSEVLEWHDTTLNNILSTQLGNSESDGKILAITLLNGPIKGSFTQGTIDVLPRSEDYASDCSRIMPFFETCLDDTTFMASFVKSVYDYSLRRHLDEANRILKTILPMSVQSFKLKATPLSRTRSYPALQSTQLIAPKVVINLIQLADVTNTDTMGIMDTLVKYGESISERIAKRDYSYFLFPVAIGICEHIGATKRSPSTGERHFFTSFLTSYVTGYVKNVPEPPSDWKIDVAISCGCDVCGSLRRFLDDPNKKTERFQMAEYRRRHLEQQACRFLFIIDTIKYGSPYTLVIEKTRGIYVSNFKAWLERAKEAQAKLKELSQAGPLKHILGDTYPSIFEHKNLDTTIPIPVLAEVTNEVIRHPIQSTVPRKSPFIG
jgi:hypothetical protein